jgi:AcrR family transcriptional regulator
MYSRSEWTTMNPPPPAAQRADAVVNRARIVEVAREALAQDSSTSLNQIAKTAGVGPGTLYRHFPTRQALLLEVYRREVQRLAETVDELLAQHPPIVALRRWFDQLAEYGMTKVGLGEALYSPAVTHDGLADESYGPVIGALHALLSANIDAGTIGPDTDADDLLLLMGFLWRIDPASDWRTRATRMTDLVFTGLLPREVAE